MNYTSGQIVDGIVTGIQPYGAFVFVDTDTSGLIHISELSESYVRDIQLFLNVGDHIKVKILDMDGNHKQLRLSLKALNPPSFRKERKQQGSASRLPVSKIGFGSLADKLDEWIEKAKKELQND